MSKKLIVFAMAIAFALSVAGFSQAADKKEKNIAKVEKSEEGASAEGVVIEKHHKGKKKKKAATEAAPMTK